MGNKEEKFALTFKGFCSKHFNTNEALNYFIADLELFMTKHYKKGINSIPAIVLDETFIFTEVQQSKDI